MTPRRGLTSLLAACCAISWLTACQCAPCPPCADGETCVEGGCLRPCARDQDCAGIGICVRAYCERGNRRPGDLDSGDIPDVDLTRDVQSTADVAPPADAAGDLDRAPIDGAGTDGAQLDTMIVDVVTSDASPPDTSSPDAGGGLDGAYSDGFICYPPGDAAVPADAASALYCGEPRIEVVIYDQILRDQEGLAAFASGACVTLVGDLTISGTGFTTLDGLRKLQQVTGTLTIEGNPCLQDLQGLVQLWRVGTLQVENNPSLRVLGLSNLSLVTQDLIIRGNLALGSAAAQQLADQVEASGAEVVENNGP